MRLIDADALIEKCGGWYVDECTESGFIGTLENILATEPTIQPQSTAGQLNDSAQSTARSTDLIDRGQAIDAINHICPVDTEYDCTLLDRVDVRCVLSDLPSVRPEKAQLFSEGTTSDLISRQAAIDALDCISGVEEVLRSLPTIQPELTDEQVAEYCKRRCLHVVTADFFESTKPQRLGHWIQYDKRFPWKNDFKCSECGNYLDFSGVNGDRGEANYCPNCGAKMKGGAG